MNRKPSALHIITRMDQGGSAVNTFFQIKETSENFDNSLLCGSLSELTEQEVAEIRSLCREFAIEPSLRRDPNPVQDAIALVKLWKFIRRGKYDIIVTHTSKAGFVGRIAAWLARAPIVTHHTHGHVFSGYFGPAKTKLFIVLEKIAARFSHMIVCLTDLEIEDHLALGIGRRDLFRSLPSGVPVEKYSTPVKDRAATRKALGAPLDAPMLVVVARLEPVKGVRRAIEAMVELKNLSPAPRLVICGEGAEREMLEKLAADLGVSDLIIAPGQRNDVADVMHAADVYISPSLYEGFGRVIVEAMCAGLPIVATNTSGAATLVREGSTGFLVPIDDSVALGQAAKKLILDPSLREKMSAAAKQAVSDELSSKAVGRKLEGFHRELLSKK